MIPSQMGREPVPGFQIESVAHVIISRFKFAGCVGGEESRRMPLVKHSSRRMPWLNMNIVLILDQEEGSWKSDTNFPSGM